VYYYFVIVINQQTKGKANMIMKLTQMCILATVAMVWQVCAASSRTITTATNKPKLWELSEQHPTESAVSRSRSVDETLKIRLTNSALGQIDPSIVHVPKTELEFLESAFGVAKSIR
jgi:ABC-type tungstate transport system permease subunit